MHLPVWRCCHLLETHTYVTFTQPLIVCCGAHEGPRSEPGERPCYLSNYYTVSGFFSFLEFSKCPNIFLAPPFWLACILTRCHWTCDSLVQKWDLRGHRRRRIAVVEGEAVCWETGLRVGKGGSLGKGARQNGCPLCPSWKGSSSLCLGGERWW